MNHSDIQQTSEYVAQMMKCEESGLFGLTEANGEIEIKRDKNGVFD